MTFVSSSSGWGCTRKPNAPHMNGPMIEGRSTRWVDMDGRIMPIDTICYARFGNVPELPPLMGAEQAWRARASAQALSAWPWAVRGAS